MAKTTPKNQFRRLTGVTWTVCVCQCVLYLRVDDGSWISRWRTCVPCLHDLWTPMQRCKKGIRCTYRVNFALLRARATSPWHRGTPTKEIPACIFSELPPWNSTDHEVRRRTTGGLIKPFVSAVSVGSVVRLQANDSRKDYNSRRLTAFYLSNISN